MQLNKQQQAKIERFMADVEMRESVYAVLLDSFLKPSPDTRVETLAASRLAIDNLRDAWKEMERHKLKQNLGRPTISQPGI